jgi:hypothetical protein
MNQFDREVEQLENDLQCGNITLSEYNKELRDMQRCYRSQAEEAAQEAYDNVIDNY